MNPLTRRSLSKSTAMTLPGIAALPSLSQAAQIVTPNRRPKLNITEIRTAEVRVHVYQVHSDLLGQIDARWSAAIKADFTSWLRENIDKLPVVREQIEEILKTRAR